MTSIPKAQYSVPEDFSRITLETNALDQGEVAELNATDDKDSSMSYIQILSDDLLLSVFSLSLFNSTSVKEVDIPVQYILCTVCRRWRNLALHAPLLWTDIYFPTNAPFDTFIFFERSIPALIDVTFSSVSTWSNSEMPLHHDVANAIAKHISRLRSVTLCILGPSELPPFFSVWRELQAPNLKNLSICTLAPPMDIFYRPQIQDAPFRDNASALQTLKLDGIEFRGLPPLPCLTTLETDRMSPTPLELRTLLDRCPALETLVVGRFGSPSNTLMTTGVQQIEAPSLVSLAINLESDHSSSCGCALPYLFAPNLQYLEISYLWPELTAHHGSILARFKDFPRLERLRIQSNSLWTGGISFFSSLQKSVILEIIGFPKHVGPILSSILSLQNLQSITLDLYSSNLPLKDQLDLGTFQQIVSTSLPTLSCRTTICCRDSSKVVVAGLEALLGSYFAMQPTPMKPGFLDDYLKQQIFDDGEDFLEMLMRDGDDLYEDYMDEDDDYQHESETFTADYFLEQDFAEEIGYSDEEYLEQNDLAFN